MTRSNIGKTLYIATALPANNDAASFEALTWVQVKGVQTLPSLGITHGGIDVSDLGTGFTRGIKGAASGKDSTFTFHKIDGDAGQASAKERAEEAAGLGAIKIVAGSGTDSGHGPAPVAGDPVEYAQGYFHSFEKNEGSDTTHEGASVSFKQNAISVEATQPA